MIKLQAAKCPQCNADIEVNTNLEKAICQYCGSTIIIEEVVPKIKIEHSGTIRIEGQKDRTYHIKQALQHIKVEEYSKALTHLREIVLNDEFDIEAYSYIVIANLNIMKENDYNIPFFLKNKNMFPEEVKIIDEFYNTINRLSTIDKDNSRNTYLDKYSKDINKYKSIIDNNKTKTNFYNIKFSKVTMSALAFSILVIALTFVETNLEFAENMIITIFLLLDSIIIIWFLNKVLNFKHIICFIISSLIVDYLFGPLSFNYLMINPLFFISLLLPLIYISLLSFLLTNIIIHQSLFIKNYNSISKKAMLKLLRVLFYSTSFFCIIALTIFNDNGYIFRKTFLLGAMIGVVILLLFKKTKIDLK